MSYYDDMMKEFNAFKKIPKVEEQLNQLWHDIDDGILGEGAKNSKWYQTMLKVKHK